MGLYFIENDIHGERSFQYYRHESAAKMCFNAPNLNLAASLATSDIIYLSGISIAILDSKARQILFEQLVDAKQHGAAIFFDNNYRERLWANRDDTLKTLAHFHQLCDYLFVTFDDEKQLFGDKTIADTIMRYMQSDIATVVIKDSEKPCHVIKNKKHYTFPTPKVVKVTDTTGAGDSFNAGFIHALVQGQPLATQVATAQALAAKVIQHQGALLTKKQFTALAV